MSDKLKELDAIRGIAIISVVLSHMGHFITPWPEWCSYSSLIGVGLFFFVSGYVLYLAHPIRITDLNTFCKKRLMRIYPLYTVAFIVGYLQGPNYYLQCSWWEILGYYLNINNILQPRYMLTLTAYWFVSAILFYYVLFIIININRYSTNTLSTFLLGSIIFAAMIGIRQFFGIIPTNWFAYFVVFVLGVTAARINLFNPKNKKYTLLALVILIISYIYSYNTFGFFYLNNSSVLLPHILTITQIALFGFVFYVLIGLLPSMIRDALCKIGFAAFAIYLFHMSIFLRLPPEYYLLGLPLSIIISYYIQKVEIHIIKRKDWAKDHTQ